MALTSAVTLDPIPNKAFAGLEGARKFKDNEKDRELGSTLDSLQQAEKEVGMKMDTPQKLVKGKYTGMGADTPLSKQNEREEQEDEENTMASLNEAKKESEAAEAIE